MKTRILAFYFSLVLVSCATPQTKPKDFVANAGYGAFTSGGAGANIVVIPQWHLPANANTKTESTVLPQFANQQNIYLQLVEWIQSRQLKSVVVEGCEGEIDSSFPMAFNGWTVKTLKSLKSADLDRTQTHIGLKLEAKFGSGLKVHCGDDLALIKKHLSTFSDLRGLLGFRMRIEQYKDDAEKLASYIDGARKVLRLSKKLGDGLVIAAIDQELKEKVKQFELLINERNESFVKKISQVEKPTAVIVGALHTEGISAGLKQKNQMIVEFKPIGLQGDEETLLNQIKKLTNTETNSN